MNIPTGFAQVNLLFAGIGIPRGAQVVYGVVVPGGGLISTAPELAEFAANTWEDSMQTQQSSSTTFIEARAKFGPNATGPDATVGRSSVGAQNAAQDSPNVAVLIRKRTPFGGKTGKGRMFFPGIAENYTQSGGLLVASDRTAMQNQADIWLAAHDTAGVPIQLLHTAAGLAPFVVTDLEVQQLLATQRRRLR